jgi:hypothetical protein
MIGSTYKEIAKNMCTAPDGEKHIAPGQEVGLKRKREPSPGGESLCGNGRPIQTWAKKICFSKEGENKSLQGGKKGPKGEHRKGRCGL